VGTVRLAGFRNATTFVLTGLDIPAKAELVRDQVEHALAGRRPERMEWTLARTDHADADCEEAASALLHLSVQDQDKDTVGRAFSRVPIELALASYPGFHVTAPPGDATPYGVFTASTVPQSDVDHVAVLPDGSRVRVPAPPTHPLAPLGGFWQAPVGSGPTRRVPLGAIAGARSGDKGGRANIGVWFRTEPAYRWFSRWLTRDRLKELLPEAAGLSSFVVQLPNLLAVNIVIDGILGEGVAASTRFDPQGKALGEWLRSRLVDVPEELVSGLPEEPA
jgi:hypothetical protein